VGYDLSRADKGSVAQAVETFRSDAVLEAIDAARPPASRRGKSDVGARARIRAPLSWPFERVSDQEEEPTMSGSARCIRSEVGEIERRLRSLEKTIERLGSRTSSQLETPPVTWLMRPHRSCQIGRPASGREQRRLAIDPLQ
jgi:hypothetical protein